MTDKLVHYPVSGDHGDFRLACGLVTVAAWDAPGRVQPRSGDGEKKVFYGDPLDYTFGAYLDVTCPVCRNHVFAEAVSRAERFGQTMVAAMEERDALRRWLHGAAIRPVVHDGWLIRMGDGKYHDMLGHELEPERLHEARLFLREPSQLAQNLGGEAVPFTRSIATFIRRLS